MFINPFDVYFLMNLDRKTIGKILIVVSLLLLTLLTLVKLSLDSQNAFMCQIVESDPNLDMADCPAHNNPNSWFIIVAFAISFVIFFIGVYLLISPDEKKGTTVEKRKGFGKLDLSKLSEDERKIYKFLSENNGSRYQSDLMKLTGFSKVKLSRILDRMENKDVLERKRRGMANLVVLK